MSKYNITFSDGTRLEGLGCNGSCLVSGTEVKSEDFAGKLGNVTINCIEGDDEAGLSCSGRIMKSVRVRRFTELTPPGWYIMPEFVTDEELRDARRDADIAYLAMMAEIEL